MKKYLIYMCIICSSITSCGKFLDQEPETMVDAKFMFQTEQGFKDALIECYIKMGSDILYGRSLTMTNIEYMAQLWDIESIGKDNEALRKNLNYTSDDYKGVISSTYGALYNVIVQANDVLCHLEETGSVIKDNTTRDIIKGEALAIRAFIHFDILRLFGDIPKNNTKNAYLSYVKTVGISDIPFIGYDDYVSNLISDLDEAEKLLSSADVVYLGLDNESDVDLFLADRRFRINLIALKALRARIALYLGNTAEAHEYALEVLNYKNVNGTNLVTLSGGEDIAKTFYSMPSETLFYLGKNSMSTNDIMRTTYLHLTYNSYFGLFEGEVTNDIRATSIWNTKVESYEQDMAIIKKYLQPTLDEEIVETGHKIIPIIRLAEIYLILIETSSLEEANSYYKDFLLHRNVVDVEDITDANKYELLKNEYKKEFFAEGYLFYFYKRNAAESMDDGAFESNLTDIHYVLPLPDSETGRI